MLTVFNTYWFKEVLDQRFKRTEYDNKPMPLISEKEENDNENEIAELAGIIITMIFVFLSMLLIFVFTRA